jgi:Putative transposase/Transposase zinc-binding domain
MTRPRLELAEIIRRHGSEFLDQDGASLSAVQRRALEDIALCRTEALGGHVEACDQCDYRRIAYNSCRNRHCPKCQAQAGADWMAARAEDLLEVEYFHVVFTIPHVLEPIARQNPEVVYGLLFRAVAETLLAVAADPKHLGARIGFHAVLHTWGQTLQYHPHVHCVVPGGGLSPDGSRWISCRPGFFLPVRVLGAVFRGKFLALLEQAFVRGELHFRGELAELTEADAFRRRLVASTQTAWVVYAKPPFGGPEQVLKYLARYTHRVAISNRRLIALEDGSVRFQYKDYAQKARTKTMTLTALEFLRRFLLHVLPLGFVRIRHFGFLSNRNRQQQVALCRELLLAAGTAASPDAPREERPGLVVPEARAAQAARCPQCGVGRLVLVADLPPWPRESRGWERLGPDLACDTS